MTCRGSCVKLNADYTLARVPSTHCSLPSPSRLLLFLRLPVARFHINDSIARFPSDEPRAGRIFYTIGGYYRISSCPSLLFLVITLASGFARIVARDVSADMCPGKIAEATACLPPVITCRLVGRDKNPPIAINHGELEKTARGNAAPRAYMLIFSVSLLLSQIPPIFRTRA